MINPILLNVAWHEKHSIANGPGTRYVLWVQGCPLACPGCFNPETHAFTPREEVPVEVLAHRILAVPGIEGVTYSGGEPMAQAQGLALLSEQLRPAGLTVVCYTGYTIEHLRARKDRWIDRLLASLDILIDGPYIREKAVNLPWRGSANQRVHFLTETYRSQEPQANEPTALVEFIVGQEEFTTTGVWPEGFLERLQEILRR